MPHAVVIGAGVAGLASALALARSGREVTLLEQSGAATPANPDAAMHEWQRPLTPQLWHSHAFVARCRELLASRAPDLLAQLLEAGATEIDLTERLPSTLAGKAVSGARDLVVIACRRTTFELVLRRIVEAEPGVELRADAEVSGLVTDRHNDVLTVRGVVTDRHGAVTSPVVIDAGGRHSRVPRWLAEMGAAPHTTEVDCGIVAVTRYYALEEGAQPAPTNRGHVAGGGFDRYSSMVFAGDNRTFSVTFGVLPEDRPLARALRTAAGFDAAARVLPYVGPWVDPDRARPISDVHVMGGFRNRLRRTVIDGRPAVLGLHLVGDAAATTNPVYSRGCTLALVHAWVLADVLVQHAHDPEAQVLAMDGVMTDELQAWFHDAIQQDRDRLAAWRPGWTPSGIEAGVAGQPTDWPRMAAVQRAATADIRVWRKYTRAQNLLIGPRTLLTDPDVRRRVEAVQRSGFRPPQATAPDHDELVELASNAPQASQASAPVTAG